MVPQLTVPFVKESGKIYGALNAEAGVADLVDALGLNPGTFGGSTPPARTC